VYLFHFFVIPVHIPLRHTLAVRLTFTHLIKKRHKSK
jgi:hypothetical protein